MSSLGHPQVMYHLLLIAVPCAAALALGVAGVTAGFVLGQQLVIRRCVQR